MDCLTVPPLPPDTKNDFCSTADLQKARFIRAFFIGASYKNEAPQRGVASSKKPPEVGFVSDLERDQFSADFLPSL